MIYTEYTGHIKNIPFKNHLLEFERLRLIIRSQRVRKWKTCNSGFS
jgi:hypothetical protein